MTKKELRIKYKALRSELPAGEIAEMSLGIANQMLTLDIWSKTYFHVFLPIVSQHEVDTEYLLHLLAGKDKEIVVSKSDFDTREMIHFLLTDNTKIALNDHGIPEPVNGLEVPAQKIDVVFVPLLAFDLAGNRVGYGKGFYDKFLAGCREDVVKIGVSFFAPEKTCGDIFESDIRLDYCVTPHQVYKFA